MLSPPLLLPIDSPSSCAAAFCGSVAPSPPLLLFDAPLSSMNIKHMCRCHKGLCQVSGIKQRLVANLHSHGGFLCIHTVASGDLIPMAFVHTNGNPLQNPMRSLVKLPPVEMWKALPIVEEGGEGIRNNKAVVMGEGQL